MIPHPLTTPAEPESPAVEDAEVPLGHDVDGDLESALRADLAAQETPLPAASPWKHARSAPTVINEVNSSAESIAPHAVPVEESVPARPSALYPPTPIPRPTPIIPPMARSSSNPTEARPEGSKLAYAGAPPTPVYSPSSPAAPINKSSNTPAPPRFARQAFRPSDDEGGMVIFNPSSMDSHDIAAELTAALTLRMKPPPEPPSDLALSTGLWLALTATAVSLWFYALVYQSSPLPYVLLLAAIEFVIGYGWVIYHSFRHDPRRAKATLLPPVTVMKLLKPSPSLGYRPLRFVITSGLLVGLYFLAPAVRPIAQSIFGLADPPPVQLPELNESPMLKIAEAEQQRSMQPLCDVLHDLAHPASLLTLTGKPKTELVEKLKELVSDSRADVRKEALTALVTWDPQSAKQAVLTALKSDRDSERLRAVTLAGKGNWKDLEIAKQVAALMHDREMASEAVMSLKRMGDSVAEEAVIPMLNNSDFLEVPILDVLETVGGQKSVIALRARAASLKTQEDKKYLESLARRIENRSAPAKN